MPGPGNSPGSARRSRRAAGIAPSGRRPTHLRCLRRHRFYTTARPRQGPVVAAGSALWKPAHDRAVSDATDTPTTDRIVRVVARDWPIRPCGGAIISCSAASNRFADHHVSGYTSPRWPRSGPWRHGRSPNARQRTAARCLTRLKEQAMRTDPAAFQTLSRK